MKPSLEGAYARIARAQEHLEQLKIKEPIVTSNETEWQEDAHGPLTLRYYEAAAPIVGILIGEIVYNLRAALDYLVYELAFLDTGAIQEGTQFPIEDSPQGFLNGKTWLRKPSKTKPGRPGSIQYLSGPHQTAIERLQPYSGTDWTKTLRNISNPDKHKRLTILQANGQQTHSNDYHRPIHDRE